MRPGVCTLRRTFSVAVVASLLAFFAASLCAHADTTTSYLFANSAATGEQGRGTAVTITITYTNGAASQTLSTGTGFQYYSLSDRCDVGFCYDNEGWWSIGTGQTTEGGQPNSNYSAGAVGQASYRDFFTFDTSVLNATDVNAGIASAVISINLFNSCTSSPCNPVQFILARPGTSSDNLNSTYNQNIDPSTYYSALAYTQGVSTLYGSTIVNSSSSSPLSFSLTSDALNAIKNAVNGGGDTGTDPNTYETSKAGALISMGGTLWDAPSQAPEPASMLLMAVGFAGLGRRRRR